MISIGIMISAEGSTQKTANEINVLMSERRIINRLVFGRDVVGGWRDSVVAGTKGQG